ncbi:MULTISPECIES: RrF2 family transcriptional regulator [unclassified Sporolactobacillus]|uniref:RrF2 family transcriptional regulator n=1 Tax=unclassified Sporolactobacillus TaxID=2628533 RepID=UPI002368F1F1|nr:Rrf2 family transcriptional regulator [Sporolactobacillus sp. CQH2019]MDD9149885.1 Rrf2 family transcriptional regulator [Sporolactobacillus sp. CQH2019]
MNSEFTIAVHCLIVLASAPDHVWSSGSLSRKVHTNPARVRKIMSVLRKNGLVTTKEGLRGGYRLGFSPADVTLAHVYRTVSCEALKLNWCSEEEADDPELASVRSVMDQAFLKAEEMLETYLERWTIDSLLEQIRRTMSGPDTSFSDHFSVSAHKDKLNKYTI